MNTDQYIMASSDVENIFTNISPADNIYSITLKKTNFFQN